MSQKKLIALVLVITVLTAYFIIKNKSPARQRPNIPTALIQVQAVTARHGDYAIEIPSQGVARAQTQTTISSQVSGNVVSVSENYREGAYFNSGEVILNIDDRDYQAQLSLAEASVDRARLAITQEQANATLAKKNWDRLNPDQAANDLVLRKPQLASARSELKSRQAQLETAKLNVERTQIRAPFSGKITNKSAEVGQYLTPGKAIANIVATSTLEIELPISAKWRSYLDWQDTKRPTVNVRIDPEDEENVWAGEIVNISADIDQQSRQITLFAEVPSSNNTSSVDLLVGDFISAKIQGKTLNNVTALPREALVDGNAIWVIRDQKIYQQEVDVLWVDDKNVVINNDDLPEGSLVNITALGYIVSGSAIEIIELDGKITERKKQTPPGAPANRG